MSSFEEICGYSQSDRVAALPSPEGNKIGSNVNAKLRRSCYDQVAPLDDSGDATAIRPAAVTTGRRAAVASLGDHELQRTLLKVLAEHERTTSSIGSCGS